MYKGYKIAALCISKIHEEEKGKMLIALNSALVSEGYRLFVYNTCTDLYWNTPAESGEKRIFELLDYSIVDAVIIHYESIKDEKLKQNIIHTARNLGKKVIVFDGECEGCINISFDYADGFAQVIDHVINHHGRERLHMLSGIKGNEFSMVREEVFRKMLEKNNLPFDEDSISYGEFWRDPAKAAVEKLLERDELPDAIICANDAMAITACSVLTNNNIMIPEEVIVTGFDGLEEIFFFTPTITSCRYSYTNLAAKIAELLVCTDKDIYNGIHRVNEEIILNESCGCNIHSRINAADYVANLGGRLYRYQNDDCAFYEHVANIQCLDDITDFYKELSTMNLYGMSCMLNMECTDETVDPLTAPKGDSYTGDMCLLYRYDKSGEFKPRSFNKADIAPDMEYMLEIEAPLIFNALNFRDVPLGYVCFYFAPLLEEYCRIPQIINSFNIAVGGYRNIRYQRYITSRIDELSKMDMLTGLYNRSGFMTVLEKRYRCKNTDLSVISVDMDKLKFINDNFGHAEGDYAIKKFAYILEKSCPGNKICGRFGGDEFAVITDCTDTKLIADSINGSINAFNAGSGKPYELSASMGVSVYVSGDGYMDFEEIFKESDRIMYEEKRKKKGNRI